MYAESCFKKKRNVVIREPTYVFTFDGNLHVFFRHALGENRHSYILFGLIPVVSSVGRARGRQLTSKRLGTVNKLTDLNLGRSSGAMGSDSTFFFVFLGSRLGFGGSWSMLSSTGVFPVPESTAIVHNLNSNLQT